MGDEEFERKYSIAGRDFINAGWASTSIKDILKGMGVRADIVRRAAIAAYEAEMNVVMYANRGTMTMRVTPSSLVIEVEDQGPGIPDIELAMKEGYSTSTQEMREMGFGAGMGLPNIRKNVDVMNLQSVVGKGTKLFVEVRFN